MTYERVQNYQKMRNLLTSAPVLAQPDYNKPFRVYIDACLDGLGAALHQIQILPSYFNSNVTYTGQNSVARPLFMPLAGYFEGWEVQKCNKYKQNG
ncbi:hypothetical protein BY996DRAFT_6653214, partial [Phakopsora pachyrhizi]